MSRSLQTALVTEITASCLRPCIFAFFDFQSGPVRVWDGLGSKTWGGNAYTGLGYLGSISAFDETTDTSAKGVTFSVSGVPNALIATVLGDNYHRRTVTAWLGAMDSAGSLVANPDVIFSGKMNNIDFDKGPTTSIINILAESRLVDLQRSRERRYTHEHQQIDFPGDDFFMYMARSQSTPFNWGGVSVGTAASGSGGDTQTPDYVNG